VDRLDADPSDGQVLDDGVAGAVGHDPLLALADAEPDQAPVPDLLEMQHEAFVDARSA